MSKSAKVVLGRIAANRVGIPFTVFVTADRAGYYKPQPQPYQLAMNELRVKPNRCLFVAGIGFQKCEYAEHQNRGN